eukprot:m.57441 g.57441  ORF g.57441 m.57441 type:complete len:462 (-) comp7827_c2_seq1:257-1642(-)
MHEQDKKSISNEVDTVVLLKETGKTNELKSEQLVLEQVLSTNNSKVCDNPVIEEKGDGKTFEIVGGVNLSKPIETPEEFKKHEQDLLQKNGKPQQVKDIIQAIVASILMGFVFGFVFEKSRAFEPENIRKQFIFEKFLMLKMFTGAMAASAASILLVYIFNRKLFEKISHTFHGCSKRGLFKSVGLGSFLLGAGMALGGACPGMVAAQLGSNVNNAWITFLGAVIGALFFGLFEPVIARWITSGFVLSKYTVTDYFPRIKYWVFSFAVLAFAIGFMIVSDVVVPWKSEIPPFDTTRMIFSLRAWPPQVSGVLLGLLQIPAMIFIKDTLGSSTGFTTVCSLATHAMSDATNSRYFSSFSAFRIGLLNWWQVSYIGAAILGAFVSAIASGSVGDTRDLITPAAAFFGGFLMLFGSRMAGGCTSGHGISGITLAMVNSIVAVPFMFAGGMFVGFIYNYANPDYV